MIQHPCIFRSPLTQLPGKAFCSHPRVNFHDGIILPNACQACQFRSLVANGYQHREMPRELCLANEVPLCFFRGSHTHTDGEYHCHHPSHHIATSEKCQRCGDYRHQIGNKIIRKWAVGVTTAPRETATLSRSLNSLAKAGWPIEQIHIFAEPNSFTNVGYVQSSTTVRGKKVGAFPNWYLALQELVLTQPNADAFLMCQDDIVFCRGVRAYLEKTLWQAPSLAFVSLYCGALQPRPPENRGFFKISKPEILYGALCVILPAASARAFLVDSTVLGHRESDSGVYAVDGVLADWAGRIGQPAFVHFPSLIGHIGFTSAIFQGTHECASRMSDSFVGEEAEASVCE